MGTSLMATDELGGDEPGCLSYGADSRRKRWRKICSGSAKIMTKPYIPGPKASKKPAKQCQKAEKAGFCVSGEQSCEHRKRCIQAWRRSGPCPRKGVKPGGIPETARTCRRAALPFRGAAILQGRAFLAWAFRSMSSASRTASTVFKVGLPCSLKERYNCSRERPVSFAN